MTGNSNFIKEPMELAYYGRDLCGEIASVHIECLEVGLSHELAKSD